MKDRKRLGFYIYLIIYLVIHPNKQRYLVNLRPNLTDNIWIFCCVEIITVRPALYLFYERKVSA